MKPVVPSEKNKTLRGLFLVFVLSLVTTVIIWSIWGFLFDDNQRPLTAAGVLQAKEIVLVSKIGGRVAKVLVHDGQRVKAGDILAEFEVPELEAKRQRLRAEIAESQALLAMLKNGPRPQEVEKAKGAADQAFENWKMLSKGYRQEDIEKAKAQRQEAESNLMLLAKGNRGEDIKQAKAMMEQAKAQFDFAEEDSRRFAELFDKGAISKREVDDAQTRKKVASENLQAMTELYRKMVAGPRREEIDAARERVMYAKNQEQIFVRGPRPEEINMARQQYLSSYAALKLLEEGSRAEEIISQEARLKQCEARLAELEAQLQDKQIAAPSEAEVLSIDLHPGETLEANRAVATLTRIDDLFIKIFVPERQLSRAPLGQVVKLVVDACPERSFVGQIGQITSAKESDAAASMPADNMFVLKVKIDNSDMLLRDGMKATVTIPPRKSSPIAAIARQVWLTFQKVCKQKHHPE